MTTEMPPRDDAWIGCLRNAESELSVYSSWASQVGLGLVRDYIRMAQAELRSHIERRQAMLAECKSKETVNAT